MIKQLQAILVCCLLLITGVQASRADDVIAEAAVAAAGEIGENISLSGMTVQIHPGSFREQATGRLSHFSVAFQNALSAALAGEGCRVSVREQGEEPLKIIGSYTRAAGDLVVTLRLRRMGEKQSTDLIVVQTEIEESRISRELLEDNLASAVESLVQRLARKTILIDDVDIVLNTPLPLSAGAPTRRFAEQYQMVLTDALAESAFFGGRQFGVQQAPYRIIPRYEIGSDQVVLKLELKDRDNQSVSESTTSLATELIAGNAGEMRDTRNLEVCSYVTAKGRQDIKPDSSRAEELTGYLSTILIKKFGITVETCRPDKNWDRILSLKLKIGTSRTADGYTIMSGTLAVEIKGHNQDVTGNFSNSGHLGSVDGSRSIITVLDKLVDDEFQLKLGGLILASRAEDPASVR